MTDLFVDSSALFRCYVADERDHAELRRLIFSQGHAISVSEVARLEFASAATAAERAGRIKSAARILSVFERHVAEDGPLHMVRFRPEAVLPSAYRLIVGHGIRSLDALHLASAIEVRKAEPDLVFVTRDRDQAAAARDEGFEVL